MKTTKKQKRAVAAGLLVLLAAAGAAYWYYAWNKPVDPTALYQTMTAAKGDVNLTVTGEARVRSAGDISLFLESPQTVLSVPVEAGDAVKAGQTLVTYDLEKDKTELIRQLSEAELALGNLELSLANILRAATGNELLQYESAITAAEKNVTDAEGEIDSLSARIRQQRLRVDNLRNIAGIYEDDYDDDLIDKEDYDIARTNYRVAKAALDDLVIQMETKTIALESYRKQLQNARDKLEVAQSPLSDEATAARYAIQKNLIDMQALTIAGLQEDLEKLTAETVSPVDGYIVAVNAVEGGTASSATAVVTLSESARRIVRFEASEFDAPQIKLGQRAEVTAAGLPGKIFTGSVTKIGAVAIDKDDSDDNEVVVPVEITLDNADDKLKIGFTVEVSLVVEERRDVIWAPVSAVFLQDSIQYAYVLEDNRAVRREVTLGLYGDKIVEVQSGILEGDILITNPDSVPATQ